MLLHLTDQSAEPLRSQITRQIRSKILLGDLVAGDVLPAPQRLARSHRVGAASAVQAYEDLSREGLLRRRDDGRLEIATLSPEQRRELAGQALLEDPREQELSLKELQLARDIQSRLLPPPTVTGGGYATVARCFPARFVAGDLYDVIPLADGSVGVVVADVVGKGFGAALVMASVKAMTPFIAAQASVEGTLRELNNRLAASLGPREFVALAYARFSPHEETVTLANAGMPDPFFLGVGEPAKAIEAQGPRLPLGLRAELEYRSVTFPLRHGERLLLFSDGIPEARTAGGEPLGYDTLARLLSAAVPESDDVAATDAWLDSLLATIQEKTGPALSDDWTAVVVQHQDSQQTARPGEPSR